MQYPFTKLTDQDFYEVLTDTRGPSIIFFTQAGCSSCRAWAVLLQQLQKDRPEFHVFYVDVQESSALSQEYAIFHLPALFIFVDGRYHSPIQSEARLPVLVGVLDRLLKEPAVEAP